MPGSIRTRRSFRLDLLGAGGAQFVAFGRHKSGRPYQWTGPASPLTLRPDDPAIPAVTRDQVAAFAAEAGRIIGPRPPAHGAARRLGRPSSSIALDGPLVRLKRLIPLHGFHGAAARVLADVQEGERNETAFAVISSALGRGLDEAEIMGPVRPALRRLGRRERRPGREHAGTPACTRGRPPTAHDQMLAPRRLEALTAGITHLCTLRART